MEGDKMITFRMFFSILFDRDIDKDRHYISPGGYEMVFGGKSVQFDFCEYSGYVDENNRRLLHCEVRDPDYDAFPGLKHLTSDDLKNLTEVKEFYVYTGENGDPEIKPVKVTSLGFRNFGEPDDELDEDIDYDYLIEHGELVIPV
jgi:hypothetical protein